MIPLDTATAARLEEVAAAHGLDAGARARLAGLLQALAGDTGAPTTVRRPREAVDVHLADSLVALDVPDVAAARRIADLGAGAGFPGLALAAARPVAEVALVESSGRKCAFIARAMDRAGIGTARVVRARAEAWPDGLAWADVVTARALAVLPVVVEYAAPLLREGGLLVAWKGEVESEERAAGGRAATTLGLAAEGEVAVRPYAASRRRALHLYRKVAPTPEGYPRRPGMARKRPLGAPGSDRARR